MIDQAKREPDWLKYFFIRAASDYEDGGVDVVCESCRDYCNFQSDNHTLWDLKYWAYYHLEECGE